MNFRTKDLMVTVLPKDLQAPVACRVPTLTVCWNQCSRLTCFQQCSLLPTCWLGCSRFLTEIPRACEPGTFPGTWTDPLTPVCGGSMTPEIAGPPKLEDLGALREQLKAQLAQLDELEKAQAAGPATLAEAETLEAHLKDALAQVQARKAELKGAKK